VSYVKLTRGAPDGHARAPREAFPDYRELRPQSVQPRVSGRPIAIDVVLEVN